MPRPRKFELGERVSVTLRFRRVIVSRLRDKARRESMLHGKPVSYNQLAEKYIEERLDKDS